jgi:bleomycin hydrolase
MKSFLTLLLVTFITFGSVAQTTVADKKFKSIIDVPATPVKSQGRTGTCWSFATTSYIESEVLRQGGPELDLSEMYFVRYTYPEKARQYIMRHGLTNFSEGGQAHDVMNVVKKYGIVTEEAFPGKRDASKPHNHSELVAVLKSALDKLINERGASPSENWYEIIEAVLKIYTGEVPSGVEYNGKTLSPVKFMEEVKIDPDDYIELTSYSHHPWYSKFNLEIPDNWAFGLYYNLPMDELMEVMNNALNNGFSVCWDGDVSGENFSHQRGLATVPEKDSDREMKITQEMRQEAFLSWQATDDHLMHITGISKDENGTIFYKTKNSWGTKSNLFGGFLYMSESYVKLNTVAIMIHKDAIPKHIAEKIFK